MRRDPYDVLCRLSGAFTRRQLAAALEVTPENATKMLGDWRKRGVVAPAGPKAGIHYNRVALGLGPDGNRPLRGLKARHMDEAIRLVHPGAVRVGKGSVHARGWTSDPSSHVVEIAVRDTPEDRTAKKLWSVMPSLRPASWFRAVMPLTVACENVGNDQPHYGMQTLPAPLAVADAWIHGESGELDPHMLELDQDMAGASPEESLLEIAEAIETVGPSEAADRKLDRLRERFGRALSPAGGMT